MEGYQPQETNINITSGGETIHTFTFRQKFTRDYTDHNSPAYWLNRYIEKYIITHPFIVKILKLIFKDMFEL